MESEDAAGAGMRRCIACRIDHPEGASAIHTPLKLFDGWCICEACVAHGREADNGAISIADAWKGSDDGAPDVGD